jgi:hypothetical protein
MKKILRKKMKKKLKLKMKKKKISKKLLKVSIYKILLMIYSRMKVFNQNRAIRIKIVQK